VGSPTAAPLLPARIVAPAGHGEHDGETRVAQQLGDLCFGGGDLGVKLGQQPKIIG
jgi:hypothetical protein